MYTKILMNIKNIVYQYTASYQLLKMKLHTHKNTKRRKAMEREKNNLVSWYSLSTFYLVFPLVSTI